MPGLIVAVSCSRPSNASPVLNGTVKVTCELPARNLATPMPDEVPLQVTDEPALLGENAEDAKAL